MDGYLIRSSSSKAWYVWLVFNTISILYRALFLFHWKVFGLYWFITNSIWIGQFAGNHIVLETTTAPFWRYIVALSYLIFQIMMVIDSGACMLAYRWMVKALREDVCIHNAGMQSIIRNIGSVAVHCPFQWWWLKGPYRSERGNEEQKYIFASQSN